MIKIMIIDAIVIITIFLIKKLMIIKIDIIDFYYWYHYSIHNVFNFVCLTSA